MSDCVLPDETCCLLGPLPAVDSRIITKDAQPSVNTEPISSTQPAANTKPAASAQPAANTEPVISTQPAANTEPSATTIPPANTKLAASAQPATNTESAACTQHTEPVTVGEELASDVTLSSIENLEATETTQITLQPIDMVIFN